MASEFNFLDSNTKQTNSNDIKTNGTRFLIGLGFAAETAAVEGISGYSYSKFKDFDRSGGFNLSLGFGWYFNRNTDKDLKKNAMANH